VTGQDAAPVAIGVDVGGTKIAAGIVDRTGKILTGTRVPTPSSNGDDVVRAIGESVSILCSSAQGSRVTRVGVGIAGLVDQASGHFLYGPHLDLVNAPLADLLEKQCGLPVFVDNDATVATLAEYLYGAGVGSSHMLMLTVGTGIGGGIVLDGRLYRGAHGFAGEFGHIYVDPEGFPCADGHHGNWESVASGTALDRFAHDLVRAQPQDFSGSGPSGEVKGADLVRAAQDGNSAALAAFDTFAGLLARGLAGLVQAFDPERVVVGGGVAAAGELLLRPLREYLARELIGGKYRPSVEIFPARLGVDAGVVGAAALTFDAG